MNPQEMLDKYVTTTFTDGSPSGFGRVVSYTEQPTFVVEDADGKRYSWRADMAHLATAEELAAVVRTLMEAK